MAVGQSQALDARRLTTGSFLAHLATFGVTTAFGALLPAISESLRGDQWAAVLMAALPTVIVLALSLPSGRLADYLGGAILVGFGGAIVALSLIIASSRLEQLSVVWWVLPLGLGGALMFVPSLAEVSRLEVPEVRARSIGVASAGSALGTLLFPPLSVVGVDRVGLGQTMFGLGLTVLVLAFVSAGCLRTPRQTPERGLGKPADSHHFRRLGTVGLVVSMSYYIPLLLLTAQLSDDGHRALAISGTVGLLGIGNFAGRILGGFALAKRRQGQILAMSALATSGAVVGLGLVSQSILTAAFWAIVYGLASGAFVVAYSAEGARLGIAHAGRTTGLLYSTMAAGALVVPVALTALRSLGIPYRSGFVVTGLVALVATVVALGAWRSVSR